MNEDSLLFTLKNYLSECTEYPKHDIRFHTSFEEDLGLDDEDFEFFLIDFQDAELDIPDLTGIRMIEVPTVGDLVDIIESAIN